MKDDERMKWQASVSSNHHSKSAYTGRVKQKENVIIVDEQGNTHEKEVSFFITWDSIEQILALVRERANSGK